MVDLFSYFVGLIYKKCFKNAKNSLKNRFYKEDVCIEYSGLGKYRLTSVVNLNLEIRALSFTNFNI